VGPSSAINVGAQSTHSFGPGITFYFYWYLYEQIQLSFSYSGSVFNHNGPGSILSYSQEYKGPSSVVNSVSNLALSNSYADGPGSVSNLAVPMTPLQSTDSVRDHQPNSQLPPSNIPAIVPATPYNAPVDIPSPTLQNIVSTVNLGEK
jgi:hypothetical protein